MDDNVLQHYPLPFYFFSHLQSLSPHGRQHEVGSVFWKLYIFKSYFVVHCDRVVAQRAL